MLLSIINIGHIGVKMESPKMLVSRSPVSGREYVLPELVDDRARLDKFVQRNQDKKIVVVQGLGFVGAVMALVVANAHSAEYGVIGIDLPSPGSYWKVEDINSGYFPVASSDRSIDELYETARDKGVFCATCDDYAYSLADFVVVDINLDVKKAEIGNVEHSHDAPFSVDLGAFTKAVYTLATKCKDDVTILVESTVPPGTCERVVKPVLDNEFRNRGIPLNYKLGHSYERVTPGPNYVNSIRNFYRVYSGIDEKSADEIRKFLETILFTCDYPLTRVGSTTASEMAKVMENSYRAMNIAFIQEWTEFGESAGINLYEIVNAIKMRPTHANLMRPGLGVGGYCLTKDPLLASWASTEFFGASPLGQSETAVGINDRMPLYTFKVISDLFDHNLSDKTVLLLGVSYLSDVADTRFTPVALLYDALLSSGARVSLHDPYVGYWEERNAIVELDLSKVLGRSYDLLVLTTGHSIYLKDNLLRDYLKAAKGIALVDAWGFLDENTVKDAATRNKVKVIGRGDL